MQTKRSFRWWTMGAMLLLATLSTQIHAAEVQKITVDGCALAWLSEGEGSPTVVIEAGGGEGPTKTGSWNSIIAAVAKKTRVITYDRAGVGASGALGTNSFRTSRDIARDLHGLLAATKVKGPYIVVGHSLGGMHARVFASEYPNEIAGMVLVDASHPDQDEAWLATLPAPTAAEPQSVTRAREFLKARRANRRHGVEMVDFAASAAQVRAARSLGDKPLIVLTHSPKWKMVPDLPDEVLAKIENESQRLQATLPQLSTNSRHIIASKAGHAIHEDEPQLVIDAILGVVDQVRKAR